MQQQPVTRTQRVHLPQGIRTWQRVLIGVCAALYLVGSGVSDGLLGSSGDGLGPLVIVLAVPQLFVLSLFLDVVIRGAYLEGTVVVDRRLYGVRRMDVAIAPGVRLIRSRFGAGLRFSAFDPPRRKRIRVALRPSTYRGSAATHPLLALADAILAGPPRPEPMGREAWVVAQQLRQAAMYPGAVAQPTGRVQPPRA